MSATKEIVVKAMQRYEDMARKATEGDHAIRPGMEVLGSRGARIGVVDHVVGAAIMLSREGVRDGRPHFVPLASVAKVDERVHLAVTAAELRAQTWGVAVARGC